MGVAWCDHRAQGSVHDLWPPFPWLCSGSCLSLVLLPLMHLSLDFARLPSTQPGPSWLVPPPGSGAFSRWLIPSKDAGHSGMSTVGDVNVLLYDNN